MWLLTSERRSSLNLGGMTSSFQPLFLEPSDLSISSMLFISNHSFPELAVASHAGCSNGGSRLTPFSRAEDEGGNLARQQLKPVFIVLGILTWFPKLGKVSVLIENAC